MSEGAPVFYIFLAPGRDARTRMATALAETFALPVDDVELYDGDDVTGTYDCRWDAPVLCGYQRRKGDLDWAFDVGLAAEVSYRPAERDLATLLARTMATPLLFPGDVHLPWIWQVATANGEVAYARLDEPEEVGEGLRVPAVEIAVPGFPNADVLAFPELDRLRAE
ncbi:hypothetical protein [Streptomyces griseocarneus]|uniref:hypothetical protein n=1 Tax=Streptomyces griseocarneus TaxID=51201 RepID=UPI00167D3441|nr:hypothetical protein [Streptomyces griseocarneus]MBZ6475449.1 hypothetical protein [Streptomyces griseocarneus]GHG75343.1 hypothetical protein GCM10018779_52880 [Streptomyces griseocarneus]